MARIRVAASARIGAPPAAVYAILADYRSGHPLILPRRAFESLEVEEGGVGAGTRIRFAMKVLGARRVFHAQISEPQPGRVLVETVLESAAVTTFRVEPEPGGEASRVTIVTEYERPGLGGWIEGRLAPPTLRSLYEEELANLARIAAAGTAHPPG